MTMAPSASSVHQDPLIMRQEHVGVHSAHQGHIQIKKSNYSAIHVQTEWLLRKGLLNVLSNVPLALHTRKTGWKKCILCPIGSFANETELQSCFLCNEGTVADSTGVETCEPCPLGTSQRMKGQEHCNLCKPCTFQNMTEQAYCIDCRPGTYQTEAGRLFVKSVQKERI